MIQYLVILLDDTAVSFCHYENAKQERRLMPIDTLRAGIVYGMKENLNIQFVYPDYELPETYKQAIREVDHINIKSINRSDDDANVVVLNGLKECKDIPTKEGIAYLLRLNKEELFRGTDDICKLFNNITRLNIVITDIETFTDSDFIQYKKTLSTMSNAIKQVYISGKSPQISILTDRMMLDKMNNCGAGDTNITLAPDGKFYICPAFYQETNSYAIGSLQEGLDIKNPQLYKLDYAPLCRNCDAYQCRRCIWLNRKTTLEVNTPSHEQCVIVHLERNASRELLENIRKHGAFLPDKENIKEIDYLDPFEVRKEW